MCSFSQHPGRIRLDKKCPGQHIANLLPPVRAAITTHSEADPFSHEI